MAKSDKALSSAALELTQKIQTHFPRSIAPEVLTSWNSCPAEEIERRLFSLFGKAYEAAP